VIRFSNDLVKGIKSNKRIVTNYLPKNLIEYAEERYKKDRGTKIL
jgi:hypothetical protein